MEIMRKLAFLITICWLSCVTLQAKVVLSMDGYIDDMRAQDAIFVLKNISDETYQYLLKHDEFIELRFWFNVDGSLASCHRGLYRDDWAWLNPVLDSIYNDIERSIDFEWIISVPWWFHIRWGFNVPVFENNREGYLQFLKYCRRKSIHMFPFYKQSIFPDNLKVSKLFMYYCEHVASPMPTRQEVLNELCQRKWPGATSSDFDISQEDITNAFKW